MVFSSSGKILYVSENITFLLGHLPVMNIRMLILPKACHLNCHFHLQSNLIGTMLCDLVWEEEQIEVQSLLETWAVADPESPTFKGGISSSRTREKVVQEITSNLNFRQKII